MHSDAVPPARATPCRGAPEKCFAIRMTTALTSSNERRPRLTRLDTFRRTTSLDKLPQLIHVMKGQILIGRPRCDGRQ